MKLKKAKTLPILRQEALSALNAIDPTKLSIQMKSDLKDTLSKDVPEVPDMELNKLIGKTKIIVWIKDAFDLIGKDSISVNDLFALKDTATNDETLSQPLKSKYLMWKKQISDL